MAEENVGMSIGDKAMEALETQRIEAGKTELRKKTELEKEARKGFVELFGREPYNVDGMIVTEGAIKLKLWRDWTDSFPYISKALVTFCPTCQEDFDTKFYKLASLGELLEINPPVCPKCAPKPPSIDFAFPMPGYTSGMTTRLFVATFILQGLMANPERYKYIADKVESSEFSQIAATAKNVHKAVLIADALIDELNKKSEEQIP